MQVLNNTSNPNNLKCVWISTYHNLNSYFRIYLLRKPLENRKQCPDQCHSSRFTHAGHLIPSGTEVNTIIYIYIFSLLSVYGRGFELHMWSHRRPPAQIMLYHYVDKTMLNRFHNKKQVFEQFYWEIYILVFEFCYFFHSKNYYNWYPYYYFFESLNEPF